MTAAPSAAEWWARARSGREGRGEAAQTWHDLPREERRRVSRRVSHGLRHPDPRVRERAWQTAETVALAEMDVLPASEHLRLEIAAARHRGEPLEPGQPVPGCSCERCTGVPSDDPAREPAWRRNNPERAEKVDHDRRERWKRMVREARRVPILDVAARLGLGDPKRRGSEVAVLCPLHDDHDPSLLLNREDGLWWCPVCGEGGDGIQLLMRARRVEFADAVRDLVGSAT